MLKPQRLKFGDTLATISLSSGMGGDKEILWRYEQGKQQLVELGFNVVELPHTLSGTDYIYKNPQERAEDLHSALLDPDIKGIVSVIGGNDSYRIFEFLDLNILKNNPKVFIGYSDSTSVHQFFQMAGVVSFYGPCLLVDFAENGGVMEFTRCCFEDVLMGKYDNYTYPWRTKWTSDIIPWIPDKKEHVRSVYQDEGPILLQGHGVVEGRLIGGCLDVYSMLRGTSLYPSNETFEGGILLLETSEKYPSPETVEQELRTMGVMGNLSKLHGILFGKPQTNRYFEEYQTSIKKILKEFNLEKLPVLYNCNFGHTEPKWTIPLGIRARIDLINKQLTLLESPLV